MKIGLLAFVTETTVDPGAVARKCESLGFDAIFIPEHPIIPVTHRTPYPAGDGKIPENYSHMPDPFVSLAIAAAATSKIKLGTGICLVPERDPILLAKEVATLDFYSGGRFIFEIGAGWLADESEIMGIDFKKRWPITREYVRAMKQLWTQPEPSFDGEYVKFPPVRHYPKPVQKPHPPIHIGAGGSGLGPNDRALKNVVAIADGWSPIGISPEALVPELEKLKQMCGEAGRDFSKLTISIYQLAAQNDPKPEIARYERAGVHRIIISTNHLEPGRADRELESLARIYLN
ncbi:MAG: LLM class F420-dependent oxidoreductase [Candidatus Binatus sp.]|uniref:LLM class F420-dependent oxidoreductase n=1 Tax=Candidatus Binatus sp. TaxID=2811406 RepID=UPI00272740AF|nr:LLM class F420-dependent oxidoreductase [Candidatus Binatus sp.]MDO8432603.1 LLM class F420-dependent oxidoreductase [Candidatus Binatus sp.]